MALGAALRAHEFGRRNRRSYSLAWSRERISRNVQCSGRPIEQEVAACGKRDDDVFRPEVIGPMAWGALRFALCALRSQESSCASSRIPAPRWAFTATKCADLPDERANLRRRKRCPERRHSRAPVHHRSACGDRVEERIVRPDCHRFFRCVRRRLHRQVGRVRPVAATSRAVTRGAPFRVKRSPVGGSSRYRRR